MILSAIILVLLLVVAFWVYFRATRTRMDRRTALIYNAGVISSAVLACVAVCLYFYLTTGQSVDHPWWPVLAGLGSLLVCSVIVIGGWVVRNYLLFRGAPPE